MPSYYMGLKLLPSSKAALIRNLYPLLVTLAGWYYLNEKITKLDILATVGAFFGVVIMNLNSTGSSAVSITEGYAYIGIIL